MSRYRHVDTSVILNGDYIFHFFFNLKMDLCVICSYLQLALKVEICLSAYFLVIAFACLCGKSGNVRQC